MRSQPERLRRDRPAPLADPIRRHAQLAEVSAGGLIFVAAATDNLIRAIDLRTGKTLWKDVLPAGGQATAIPYETGGRQYPVLCAGGHYVRKTPIGDVVMAYALPS